MGAVMAAASPSCASRIKLSRGDGITPIAGPVTTGDAGCAAVGYGQRHRLSVKGMAVEIFL